MQTAFKTVCTIGGKCLNLVKATAPVVGKLAPVVGKMVTSRNEYAYLERDLAIAQRNAKTLQNVVTRIEKYQDSVNVKLCTLTDAHAILKKFEEFIAMYKPETFRSIMKEEGVTSKTTAATGEAFRRLYPDWYRTELQSFNNLMQSTVTNVQLELITVNAHLQHAKTLPPQEQQALLQKLNSYSCLKFEHQPTKYSNIHQTPRAARSTKRTRRTYRGARGGVYYRTHNGQKRYIRKHKK